LVDLEKIAVLDSVAFGEGIFAIEVLVSTVDYTAVAGADRDAVARHGETARRMNAKT
jgi:hypothetical protein